MELSWIAREILENAIVNLVDAEYDNNARIYIGESMVLVDKDDFEELKQNILDFDPDCDTDIKTLEFKDIVPDTDDEES